MQKMSFISIVEFQGDGYMGVTIIIRPMKKVSNVNE